MTTYVYRYPDGAAGLGLLALRLCYAPVTFGVAAALPTIFPGASVLRVAVALAAFCLVIGLATRWIALLLGIAVVAVMTTSNPEQQLLLAGHVGGCLAIASMGAGAFSIDARRHGRRVIRLETNAPDRGSDD